LLKLIPRIGETARVHFISKRGGRKWHTVEFTVVRDSDKKMIDIGHHTLTETGEPLLEQK
jgi:hypothetical protein